MAHLWRNRQKRATTYRSELTKRTVKISHHVATSLYVPIPSIPHSKPALLSLLPSSTVAKCRPWALFGVRPSAPASPAATVVSCRRPRTSFVFLNRRCHMHTPHMMNVTLKTVAPQLWRNPEHFAQPEEATGNKRLPQNRIGPGARIDTEIARS